MAEKTEVKSTVIEMIPGKMNSENLMPLGPVKEGESAVPSTNRKRIGWPSEATIRALSYQ